MTQIKPRILAVDDEPWNIKLLETYLIPQGYEVVGVGSAQKALDLLAAGQSFDLILTDAMMPIKDGFDLCREIKQNKKYSSIPVLLVTALQETLSKVKGLEAGASDFISKPVDSAELSARIRAHLRIKTLMDEIESWNHALEEKVEERTRTIVEKNRQLDEAYFLTVETLVMALDAREMETGKHSLRVAFCVAELARQAGITGRELEEIAMGALLHDIGKIGIPDEILLKPGKLSHEEWIIMRKHPEIGWKLVKDIEFFGRGREVVLQHQECYDGSGYPQKLKGDEIFFGARLFAVIDTLDVLMSARSYKEAMPYEMARVIIQKSSGTHFDPRAVDVFLGIAPGRWQELREGVKQGSLKSLIRDIRSANQVVG